MKINIGASFQQHGYSTAITVIINIKHPIAHSGIALIEIMGKLLQKKRNPYFYIDTERYSHIADRMANSKRHIYAKQINVE